MSNLNVKMVGKEPSETADSKFTSDEPSLFIGKHDKSITLLDKGDVIPLISRLERYETSGQFKIPSNLGDFILQWGRVNLQETGSTMFNFNEEWRHCFGIVITQIDGVNTENIKAKVTSNSQFQLTTSVNGGAGTVQWFAFGF